MRWRLLRRRLSISAPRMAVRSHLPWPLRWAVAALMLGFSAALALWAFEFGRNIAGLNHGARQMADVLEQTREQLAQARQDRDRAQSVANSADSLLKAERVTQQRLAEQVKALEAENLALKDDLGFFERLLPATGGEGVSVRGLQGELTESGQLRYRLLVMQRAEGRIQSDFVGRFELWLSGTRDGKPWADAHPVVARPLQFKQYSRVEGVAACPQGVQLRLVQVRVLDGTGGVRASQSLRL
ncbi:MAG: DUF6776 family protein [Aquabacterium sp.]